MEGAREALTKFERDCPKHPKLDEFKWLVTEGEEIESFRKTLPGGPTDAQIKADWDGLTEVIEMYRIMAEK